MHPNSEFSLSSIQRKRGESVSNSPVATVSSATSTASVGSAVKKTGAKTETDASGSSGFKLPFDPLRVADAVYRKIWLILISGVLVGSLLVLAGRHHFETHYQAVAQIIKQPAAASIRQSESGDPYQPHELTIPTLTALMRDSTLMEKTSSKLKGKISEGTIKAGLLVVPERNTDIVKISINSDADAETAVMTLRAYVEEVLTLTRDIQQHDAAEMNRILTEQVAIVDADLLKVNEELLAYAKREALVDADKQMDALLGELASFNLKYETTRLDHETLDLKIQSIERELSKISPAAARLQEAREGLAQLQLRYTNEHPTVIESMDRVMKMEAALADDKPRLDVPPKAGESTVGESLYLELIKLRSEKQVLGEQLGKLSEVSAALNGKLEQLPRKALEYAKIRSRKQALETSRGLLAARQREAAMFAENAQGSYRLLSMARIQDVIVEGYTKKLGLVGAGGFAGTAGGLTLLFALLAIADRRVLTPADLGRCTGLPILGSLGATPLDEAQAEAWAFLTWTRLQPSLQMPVAGGAAVCGLLTAGQTQTSRIPSLLARAAACRGFSVIVVSCELQASPGPSFVEALAQPERILFQLGERAEQVIHLSLEPDWKWTHDQRLLWQRALMQWTQARSTVILVQLSRPADADTLLVAERMPNLLWVSESEAVSAELLQTQMSIYRTAGCRLVGAVLNKAPRFKLGLLNKLAATACLLLLGSVSSHAESLVLGPGDAVNISVAGRPEYTRSQVSIGPDGKLTYLQSQNIQAAGLTIDELRAALGKDLQRYYKNMTVVVTPMTFQSRKVYVLGKVVKKGAINMDRPLTVLEIVAEAGGLETGLFQQNTVELADLGRSFLMRGRQRMPVDMEALFLRGDVRQNIQVQPGDYLYFPSANSNEIYVLGNVKMQGAQGLLAHTSVHSAIAQAGGFAPKAYTRHILVVRGSLEKPEAFVVNMEDILAGRAPGFRLQPKDIVYIADKPWARAEELLSFALNAFLQGAVSGWAGANVGPFIKDAILPQVR